MIDAQPNQFIAFNSKGDTWDNDYSQNNKSGEFYRGATPFPETVSGESSTELQILLANRDIAIMNCL